MRVGSDQRLDSVIRKIRVGRFREALDDLARVYRRDSELDALLMAEVKLRLGAPDEARRILGEVAIPRASRDWKHARHLELLGAAAKQTGNLREAVDLLTRSVSVAEEAGDLEQVCRSQLALLSSTVEVSGPDSVGSLASAVRRNVLRLGRQELFGALHVRFAEVEARRGSLDLAERHLGAAFVCIENQESLLIEGQAHLRMSVLAALRARLDAVKKHSEIALTVARVSGNRVTEFASLSNLGLVSVLAGDTSDAERYCLKARALAERRPYDAVNCLDNMAQLELLRGDLAKCGVYVDEIKAITGSVLKHQPWCRLASNLTVVKYLIAIDREDEALAVAEESREVAHRRQDRLLEAQFNVACASLKIRKEEFSVATSLLIAAEDLVGKQALQTTAMIEWVTAEALVAQGDAAARSHAERALRVATTTGLHAIAEEFRKAAWPPTEGCVDSIGQDAQIVKAVAHIVGFAGEPELLGREIVALVGKLPKPGRARLVAKEGQSRTELEAFNWKEEDDSAETFVRARPISLGGRQDIEYELFLEPYADLASQQLMRAVATLLRAALAVEKYEIDERGRTSLWPPDEDLMLGGHIYVAPRMRELVASTRRIAATDLPVLITGETGTGKEVIAREVHDASHRAKKPFVPFVCSAVPRETLDSHLFGHRRGAFTGAVDSFLGVIRANDGGTLFLDEIAEISADLQTKLLRFLETGEIHPLGETRPVKVNVRVIAATNQPLEQLLADGRFREDFYYRLNVMRFHLPPLRERREEILPLIDHFLTRECSQIGKPVPALSDEAVEHLLLHRWPGNIRQLYNEMRRIVAIIEPGVAITPEILAPEIVAERRAAVAAMPGPSQVLIRLDQPLQAGLEELERAMIHHALANSDGHLETAARRLSITRKGLFLKRQRLEIA